ncbi:hypothetical protein N0V88_005428 [Collariella sp. IMI 366227]|nr:hypothetical protein N0V88_005428 [Collariella sp. IMI 366227]
MSWQLSAWLAFARSAQLLGSMGAAGMHGYLTILVYKNRLGLSKHMVVLELLVSFTYIFTIIATILRVLEHRYTKNTKVYEILESLERADEINLKPVPHAPNADPLRRIQPPPLPIITTTINSRGHRRSRRSPRIRRHAPVRTNPAAVSSGK